MGGSSRGLKYKKAWDIKENRYRTPDDVFENDRASMHDRLRYFSERFEPGEDRGKVLTLHKKSINGNREHFQPIADNTLDYRKKTKAGKAAQESLVHKVCKEAIKEVYTIHVCSVKAEVLGNVVEVFPECILPMKYVCVEKRDEDTGRIPDAKVMLKMFGRWHEVFVEFCYKHAVPEDKRKQYEASKKNCLEVDISSLQFNLGLSATGLKTKIKAAISTDAYWVSFALKGYIDEALKERVAELTLSNGLLEQSRFYTENGRRAYVFKNKLVDIEHIPETNPCYFVEDMSKRYTWSEKTREIWQCLDCKHCLGVAGYTDPDINNLKVYCSKAAPVNNHMLLTLVNSVIIKAKERMNNDSKLKLEMMAWVDSGDGNLDDAEGDGEEDGNENGNESGGMD